MKNSFCITKGKTLSQDIWGTWLQSDEVSVIFISPLPTAESFYLILIQEYLEVTEELLEWSLGGVEAVKITQELVQVHHFVEHTLQRVILVLC